MKRILNYSLFVVILILLQLVISNCSNDELFTDPPTNSGGIEYEHIFQGQALVATGVDLDLIVFSKLVSNVDPTINSLLTLSKIVTEGDIPKFKQGDSTWFVVETEKGLLYDKRFVGLWNSQNHFTFNEPIVFNPGKSYRVLFAIGNFSTAVPGMYIKVQGTNEQIPLQHLIRGRSAKGYRYTYGQLFLERTCETCIKVKVSQVRF